MEFLLLVLGGAGLTPLGLALAANWRSSLRDSLLWLGSAWLVWLAHFFLVLANQDESLRHWALSFTGCAMVAVLGARRPRVGPWNLVVLGLLAVLSLPVLQKWFLGIGSLDLVQSLLLPATLVVGVLNFLPTRLGVAALGVGLGSLAEMKLLLEGEGGIDWAWRNLGYSFLLCPWLGWLAWQWGPQGANEVDRAWFYFRDRFGLLWAVRVRDQFNSAARNAGWPVFLAWRGVRGDGPAAAMGEVIRAVLQPFEGEKPRPPIIDRDAEGQLR